jgi:hypothetical protein
MGTAPSKNCDHCTGRKLRDRTPSYYCRIMQPVGDQGSLASRLPSTDLPRRANRRAFGSATVRSAGLNAVKGRARKIEFRQPIQRDLGRPDPAQNKFSFSFCSNGVFHPIIPPHAEGRTRRHDTWSAGCGGRDSVAREKGSQGGLKLCLGPVSDCLPRRTSGAVRVRQNRVVLAPVAGVKLCEGEGAQPGPPFAANSRSDGGKTNSSPGRARHKPSNHCAGKAGMSRLHLWSFPCAFLCTPAAQGATGASWHPVFPAPSRERGATSDHVQLGRVAPRECGVMASLTRRNISALAKPPPTGQKNKEKKRQRRTS